MSESDFMCLCSVFLFFSMVPTDFHFGTCVHFGVQTPRFSVLHLRLAPWLEILHNTLTNSMMAWWHVCGITLWAKCQKVLNGPNRFPLWDLCTFWCSDVTFSDLHLRLAPRLDVHEFTISFSLHITMTTSLVFYQLRSLPHALWSH